MNYVIGHIKPDLDSVASAIAASYMFNQKNCFGYKHSQAVIADPINNETKYVFEKFGIDTPELAENVALLEGDTITLVDHNEQDQRSDFVQEDYITEIIDHHKLNLSLNKAVFVTTKTWGSTCTILYFLMKTNDIAPSLEIAQIMLASILSDTVGFKSSLTTEKDRELGAELAKIAGIDDIDEFTFEIFKAKSDISNLSAEEIVTNDYKIFDFAGKKVLIDQVETVEQITVLDDKDALVNAMEITKAQEQVDYIFVIVSDILNINSKLLYTNDEEKDLAERAFNSIGDDNIIDIGQRLSRKKEIAPFIEKELL